MNLFEFLLNKNAELALASVMIIDIKWLMTSLDFRCEIKFNWN